MKLKIPSPPFTLTRIWRLNKLPGEPRGLPAKRVAERLRELGYVRRSVREGGRIFKAWVYDPTYDKANERLDKLL